MGPVPVDIAEPESLVREPPCPRAKPATLCEDEPATNIVRGGDTRGYRAVRGARVGPPAVVTGPEGLLTITGRDDAAPAGTGLAALADA
jgi:hypothetical protein